MSAVAILQSGRPDECLVNAEFPLTRKDLSDIAGMIYSDAGIALNETKASLVYSRLSKRLRQIGLGSFKQYCALVSSPEGFDERREMLSFLTTNFTRFFRENHHFQHLRDEVLPGLLTRANAGGRVRIWSAGCSDGQEPYSIALTLLDMAPNAASLDVRILATDIDPKIIAQAQVGIYDAQAIETVDPRMRKQWFTQTAEKRWQISDQVRKQVTFRELNLMALWPFRGPFDVIFCRNVVIYFDEATQNRVWARYADLLPPGGHLYIGHSERLSGEARDRFESTAVTIYRCKGRI
ncbi:methylase of chemotaxis methyl-accepting protein [Hoeflea sp. IMCC20628]|uniref:protein-glutamate O-methyltransferase n=1 Tax=Hoeflea sp. IMCC20628 TaxID=1620421 RepID=UPI00063ABB6C|nr:protein-glutamate O-methyltransferase [Hoeflea sp. IMCC20628]AKI02178.1 methylase of chemotaxis methyl-accepting protein [Hoeflea sp. IMCC20628]